MSNQYSMETISSQTSVAKKCRDIPCTVSIISPGKVIRGAGVLSTVAVEVANLGTRPLIIAGNQTINISQKSLQPLFQSPEIDPICVSYGADCCEASLKALGQQAREHQADVIIGFGGGKALDTAKLVAHQLQLPVVTIPTSGATCAAWTALSNVYSETGAFLYDVALSRCPDVLMLDYDLLQTAPPKNFSGRNWGCDR